jgi:gamma-glutamyltranspeptidase/glutathione hydrolase
MSASIESAFCSRLMAAGFMLNNELTDFSFQPEADGRPVANRVQAGKRPRSSMAPTMVLDGNGRLVLAVGSPGGIRIIGYVLKAVIASLDWGMDMQAAIDLPNVVNRNGATDVEEGAPAVLVDGLTARGHEVKVGPLNSGLHGIAVALGGQTGGLTGGADPRREGVALGD